MNSPRRNPIDEQEYLWIPAGRFRMGCVEGDNNCEKDETPRHPVQIRKRLLVAKTEVSVETYQWYGKQVGIKKMPSSPPENNGWHNATVFQGAHRRFAANDEGMHHLRENNHFPHRHHRHAFYFSFFAVEHRFL